MSEAQSYGHAFEAYDNEFVKQQGLDFFSFNSPTDILAPHPDLFESDIDSNLAAYPDQLQLLTVDSNEAYNFFRTEKPQWQGPLSTITVSESYDSLSSHSESFYNEQISPFAPQPVNCAQLYNNYDLEMDFQRVRVGSEYSVQHLNLTEEDINDPTSFGALPPTPPRSPPVPMNNVKVYPARTSISEYGLPRRSSTTSSDYYSHSSYSPPSHGHPTVSPLHISTQLPTVASVNPPPTDDYKGDPRKKYRCSACPRG